VAYGAGQALALRRAASLELACARPTWGRGWESAAPPSLSAALFSAFVPRDSRLLSWASRVFRLLPMGPSFLFEGGEAPLALSRPGVLIGRPRASSTHVTPFGAFKDCRAPERPMQLQASDLGFIAFP